VEEREGSETGFESYRTGNLRSDILSYAALDGLLVLGLTEGVRGVVTGADKGGG
jgi:hypothetical protein